MSTRWSVGAVLDCGCHVPAGTVAVPISMAEVTGMADIDRCDFCGHDIAGRDPAHFTATPLCRNLFGVHVAYDGSWWACTVCAPLVIARAWRKLADRVLGVGAPPHLARPGTADTSIYRAEICALWLDMERHGLAGPIEAAA